MTSVGVRPSAGVSEQWLRLREPADAAARSTALAGRVRQVLGATRGCVVGDASTVVHDLGSGSGSMGRWLAPQLKGPQCWVLHDRDPDLLRAAAEDPPGPAADGTSVTLETRPSDVTGLGVGDLAGASLVTASALLDMFCADELERFVAACVAGGCPVLLTLSVTGQVRLSPTDPLDAELESAFNAHQQRTVGGGALLGPAAAGVAAELFTKAGFRVEFDQSPWNLDAYSAELTAEWLRGWVGAAVEQRPDRAAAGDAYLERRRGELATGLLAVAVQHVDLLALPGPSERSRE